MVESEHLRNGGGTWLVPPDGANDELGDSDAEEEDEQNQHDDPSKGSLKEPFLLGRAIFHTEGSLVEEEAWEEDS